jgi:argininosuccinate synthase
VGRIDHIENRLVGIKSREVYEAPAAVILHTAHQELEKITLTKEQTEFKALVARELANLVYNGRWFSAHHQDLAAYVASSQRYVSGSVRLKLRQGACWAVGRRSPKSLYQMALATYGREDQFDQSAAVGFINIWGLSLRTQARYQLQGGSDEMLRLSAPGAADGPTE